MRTMTEASQRAFRLQRIMNRYGMTNVMITNLAKDYFIYEVVLASRLVIYDAIYPWYLCTEFRQTFLFSATF